MTKAALRNKYKQLREAITTSEIEDQSLAIANKLLELPIWEHSYYHIFLPIASKKEINTEYIISILNGKDKNVIVPKTVKEENGLAHYLLTDSTPLRINEWGIPEPVEGITLPPEKFDVVFVPLLAYDEKGNRLGYGKGFYDRFLAQCREDSLKIGLSLFPPEKEIPSEAFDVRLTHCVTANEISFF